MTKETKQPVSLDEIKLPTPLVEAGIKYEHPTPVPYVTLRNWQFEPDLGKERVWQLVKYSKKQRLPDPLKQHIDFHGYLNAVSQRITLNGSINTPFEIIYKTDLGDVNTAQPIETAGISQLNLEERVKLRDRLASRILGDAHLAALAAHAGAQDIEPQQIEKAIYDAIRKESLSAIRLAPYRHEPGFLREIMDRAQKAQDEEAAYMSIPGVD